MADWTFTSTKGCPWLCLGQQSPDKSKEHLSPRSGGPFSIDKLPDYFRLKATEVDAKANESLRPWHLCLLDLQRAPVPCASDVLE
ncbi:hypothetical protein CB1_056579046 [Camelus ferus]|nr:hypothetical protein CB1_056579046 [Camelus ferus]